MVSPLKFPLQFKPDIYLLVGEDEDGVTLTQMQEVHLWS